MLHTHNYFSIARPNHSWISWVKLDEQRQHCEWIVQIVHSVHIMIKIRYYLWCDMLNMYMTRDMTSIHWRNDKSRNCVWGKLLKYFMNISYGNIVASTTIVNKNDIIYRKLIQIWLLFSFDWLWFIKLVSMRLRRNDERHRRMRYYCEQRSNGRSHGHYLSITFHDSCE